MVHGNGIFTYIWLKFMIHVGKYSSPMQPFGYNKHVQCSGFKLKHCASRVSHGMRILVSTIVRFLLWQENWWRWPFYLGRGVDPPPNVGGSNYIKLRPWDMKETTSPLVSLIIDSTNPAYPVDGNLYEVFYFQTFGRNSTKKSQLILSQISWINIFFE